MSNYRQISFDISPKQRKSITGALNSGSSVQIKLTNKQLHGNNATSLVTPTQYNRIMNAKNAGKGIVITLSKKQLDRMKKGGFLPVLLGAAVSSLLPLLFNKIFPDKNSEGSGINVPGGRGMAKRKIKMMDDEQDGREAGMKHPSSNLPFQGQGMGVEPGMIVPDNGGNTSLHIQGYSSRNGGYGNGIRVSKPAERTGLLRASVPGGNGLVLPGTTMARSGSKTAKKYAAKTAVGTGMKKKRQRACGYIAPGTEAYQMLE